MHQAGLFDEPESPFRTQLAGRLARLASEGIYVGTSSWKYEGWLGQIYTPERYQVRGRFSRKRFDETCLAEYAETFPIVCGDFAFYQFPSHVFWQRLFGTSPPSLRFAFKVPEEITVKTFPVHDRYGAKAGLANPTFLDVEMFQRMFLEPLEPYAARVAVLIFEFGTFSSAAYAHAAEFIVDLDRFLGQLPRGHRYAVEIRNPGFLTPAYLACLRSHGAAHVFNAWTRMPELETQIEFPGIETAEFTVTRALLRIGRPYELAVKKFQPYSEVQEVNNSTRSALRAIIGRARESKRGAFVFVNNRLEGNAPGTIAAVVGED